MDATATVGHYRASSVLTFAARPAEMIQQMVALIVLAAFAGALLRLGSKRLAQRQQARPCAAFRRLAADVLYVSKMSEALRWEFLDQAMRASEPPHELVTADDQMHRIEQLYGALVARQGRLRDGSEVLRGLGELGR